MANTLKVMLGNGVVVEAPLSVWVVALVRALNGPSLVTVVDQVKALQAESGLITLPTNGGIIHG